ncbi:hypothetical protein PoB_004554900 [Plakobranchus ocellatus]|uniref:Uncharacterized protein n=1 Tax=Plakobranchus ocellatus TaxID=259542 RepID=A0AAV4BJF0_9GAST|nr:hypothetical protein PoB_004554900 [Plakobranchus ocellatus]
MTASASSQPSHTITCSMFPWDDRGDGHPSDTTLLNTLAPVLVAHGLLTHVHKKVISGFQTICQTRGAEAGLDPAPEGSLEISGRTH